MEFSTPERALLQELQRDCSQSLAQIAQTCGMAQSTVWRKVQEMEAQGVITSRVALLNAAHVGCKLTVLAAVTLSDHAENTVAGFARLIEGHPEIIECLATSGGFDYSLKIKVADVEAYEQFMTHTLLRSNYVRSVQSSFVLKELKSTTALPI